MKTHLYEGKDGKTYAEIRDSGVVYVAEVKHIITDAQFVEHESAFLRLRRKLREWRGGPGVPDNPNPVPPPPPPASSGSGESGIPPRSSVTAPPAPPSLYICNIGIKAKPTTDRPLPPMGQGGTGNEMNKDVENLKHQVRCIIGLLSQKFAMDPEYIAGSLAGYCANPNGSCPHFEGSKP